MEVLHNLINNLIWYLPIAIAAGLIITAVILFIRARKNPEEYSKFKVFLFIACAVMAIDIIVYMALAVFYLFLESANAEEEALSLLRAINL